MLPMTEPGYIATNDQFVPARHYVVMTEADENNTYRVYEPETDEYLTVAQNTMNTMMVRRMVKSEIAKLLGEEAAEMAERVRQEYLNQ